ncbi:hypothetical protein VDGL01_08316 [Verticillium dahliae]
MSFSSESCQEKNVQRLVRIFKKEGCDRLNPRHAIPANVSADVLRASLEASGLSANDLKKPGPQALTLPPKSQVTCLHGKHRVSALKLCRHLEAWWAVELYVDIFNQPATSLDARRWWDRLSPHKAEIARRILNHQTLGLALRNVLAVPGLRSGLQLGIWSMILPERCDEEVLRCLQKIIDVLEWIFGSQEALEALPPGIVHHLEGRAPGASHKDFLHISGAIEREKLYIADGAKKQAVLDNLKVVDVLIPSLHTLQQDFKYVRQCTGVLRKLILGSSRVPLTTQTLAYQAFKSNPKRFIQVGFWEGMTNAYLHIMQNLVELSGENPLLEPDEPKAKVRQYGQAAWHQLALVSRDLGFVSDEIARLCSLDPDKEYAVAAMLQSRPPRLYSYGPDFDDLANIVAGVFKKAQRNQAPGAEPSLTTDGHGEPTVRRCGRQYSGSYIKDRHFLTAYYFKCEVPKNQNITSLFVRRSVFLTFWGFQDASMPGTPCEVNPGIPPVNQGGDHTESTSIISPTVLEPKGTSGAVASVSEALDQSMMGVDQAVALGANQIAAEPGTAMAVASVPDAVDQSMTGLDQALVARDDHEMTILVRQAGFWEVAKRCRRRSIRDAVTEAWRNYPSFKLFNQEGLGIDLQDCTDGPVDVVCLNEDGFGFPAEETY